VTTLPTAGPENRPQIHRTVDESAIPSEIVAVEQPHDAETGDIAIRLTGQGQSP
jgi:hypothetical protein